MSATPRPIREGDAFDLATHVFTADEIVAFASRFDPQPFHLEDDAARAMHFGRLSASGWHSAALFVRLFSQALAREHVRARLGPWQRIHALRWLEPARLGDAFAFTAKITGLAADRDRVGWQVATVHGEGMNQLGELAFVLNADVLIFNG